MNDQWGLNCPLPAEWLPFHLGQPSPNRAVQLCGGVGVVPHVNN